MAPLWEVSDMLLTKLEIGAVRNPFSDCYPTSVILIKAPDFTIIKRRKFQEAIKHTHEYNSKYSHLEEFLRLGKENALSRIFNGMNTEKFLYLEYIILPETKKKLTPKRGTKAILNIAKRRNA